MAISPENPNIAYFIAPGEPASTHDFLLYQKHLSTYAFYLKVREEEQHHPFIRGSTYWDLLADKGYIGELGNSEPYKRITPKKSNMRGYSSIQNETISKFRVKIECYFGRSQRIWRIMRDYKLDEKNFDFDIDNCFLLTNEELIAGNIVLDDEDFNWYRKYLKKLEQKRDSVTLKRKQNYYKMIARQKEITSEYHQLNQGFIPPSSDSEDS